MKIKFSFYLLLLLSIDFISLPFSINSYSLENINPEDLELIFVYEHCRHGSRSPVDKKNGLFNKDKKTDIYGVKWEKTGKLTDYGKIQHYFLGLRNKFRYKNLIDFSHYNPDEIVTRSTGVIRSLQSLYYQMLGMFSSDEEISKLIADNSDNNSIKNDIYLTLNDSLLKYAMPPNVEYWEKNKFYSSFYQEILSDIKQNKKYLINLKKIKEKIFKFGEINHKYIFLVGRCDSHHKYIENEAKKKYKEKIKEYIVKPFQKKLTKINKKFSDEKFFYKSRVADGIMDQFIADYLDGKEKELQKFFDKTGIDKNSYIKSCFEILKFHCYNIYCHSKSCVMNASPYMNYLLEVFDQKISDYNNNKKVAKILIDAGHDNTVNMFQILMHKTFKIKVNYCSYGCNIFFEIYKIKNKDDFVIKYLDNDEELLTIGYKEFKQRIGEMLWSDEERIDFCKNKMISEVREEQDEDKNFEPYNLKNNQNNDYNTDL